MERGSEPLETWRRSVLDRANTCKGPEALSLKDSGEQERKAWEMSSVSRSGRALGVMVLSKGCHGATGGARAGATSSGLSSRSIFLAALWRTGLRGQE